MDQTNWSVVLDIFWIVLLPQKYHESLIQKVETSEISRPEGVESPHDVVLDDRLGMLIEKPCESVGPRRLVGWQACNGLQNFLFGE